MLWPEKMSIDHARSGQVERDIEQVIVKLVAAKIGIYSWTFFETT